MLRRLSVFLALAAMAAIAAAAGGPAAGPTLRALAAGTVCSAQTPGAYPNDPGYSPAENGQAGQTWDNELWYLYGCIPQGVQNTSSDPEGAAGMSVDKTWSTFTKGRDDVLVAYMEGGINWRIGESCELRLRSYLNRGELPYPENAQG